MGLLDTLEQAAGLGGQAGGANGQGAGAISAVSAVVSMLEAQPGGTPGVIQKFEAAGLGGVVQSWAAPGPNQAISPSQVQSTLGPGPIAQVAQTLGVPSDQAAQHVANFLPQIQEHLGGAAAAGEGLGQLEGLLQNFGGRTPGQ